jgi:hypothetical protein
LRRTFGGLLTKRNSKANVKCAESKCFKGLGILVAAMRQWTEDRIVMNIGKVCHVVSAERPSP